MLYRIGKMEKVSKELVGKDKKRDQYVSNLKLELKRRQRELLNFSSYFAALTLDPN